MPVDDTPDGNSQPVDTCQMRTSGGRMALQLKRPGWCVNTSESGPNPDKEGYVDSTASRTIRERIADAEWHRDVAIGGANTKAASYFLGMIAAFQQCLHIIGEG